MGCISSQGDTRLVRCAGKADGTLCPTRCKMNGCGRASLWDKKCKNSDEDITKELLKSCDQIRQTSHSSIYLSLLATIFYLAMYCTFMVSNYSFSQVLYLLTRRKVFVLSILVRLIQTNFSCNNYLVRGLISYITPTS